MLKLAGLLKEGVEEWIDEHYVDIAPHEELHQDGDKLGEIEVRRIIDQINEQGRKDLGPDDLYIPWSADAMIKSGIDTPEKLREYFAEQEAEAAREGLKSSLHGQDNSNEPVEPVEPDEPDYDKIYGPGGFVSMSQNDLVNEDIEGGDTESADPEGADSEGADPEGAGDVLQEAIRSLVREVLLEKAKTYKGKSMRLGGGGRFAKFVDSLKKSGKSEEQARAIAYKAGAKKYGKGKMAKMAAAGKKREAKKEA